MAVTDHWALLHMWTEVKPHTLLGGSDQNMSPCATMTLPFGVQESLAWILKMCKIAGIVTCSMDRGQM